MEVNMFWLAVLTVVIFMLAYFYAYSRFLIQSENYRSRYNELFNHMHYLMGIEEDELTAEDVLTKMAEIDKKWDLKRKGFTAS